MDAVGAVAVRALGRVGDVVFDAEGFEEQFGRVVDRKLLVPAIERGMVQEVAEVGVAVRAVLHGVQDVRVPHLVGVERWNQRRFRFQPAQGEVAEVVQLRSGQTLT